MSPASTCAGRSLVGEDKHIPADKKKVQLGLRVWPVHLHARTDGCRGLVPCLCVSAIVGGACACFHGGRSFNLLLPALLNMCSGRAVHQHSVLHKGHYRTSSLALYGLLFECVRACNTSFLCTVWVSGVVEADA